MAQLVGGRQRSATLSPGVSDGHKTAPGETPVWRQLLASAYTSVPEFLRRLRLEEVALPPAPHPEQPPEGFGLLVPEPFIRRMVPGDLEDPLLKQVLPTSCENLDAPGFTDDPLAEQPQTAVGPVLRKYAGRCLILATAACAIHCRFCFRRCRRFKGALEDSGVFSRALDDVAADASIREVILSGGDPLIVENVVIARFLEALADIPHVRRVRIHSRVPVALPQRVDEELPAILASFRLPVFLVIHTNHPREIDEEVSRAVARFISQGIPVLSQSVLLRGINDKPEILAELFEILLQLRVLPYYLHQLDKVRGAPHFEVSPEEGKRLVAALRERLPGYGVPRYVREIPGRSAKEVLA